MHNLDAPVPFCFVRVRAFLGLEQRGLSYDGMQNVPALDRVDQHTVGAHADTVVAKILLGEIQNADAFILAPLVEFFEPTDTAHAKVRDGLQRSVQQGCNNGHKAIRIPRVLPARVSEFGLKDWPHRKKISPPPKSSGAKTSSKVPKGIDSS